MNDNPFLLSSYQYELPSELIAQFPITPRDSSRLMIIDRSTGQFSEIVFRELVDFLSTGDGLVFNDTKVIPARLIGKRKEGGISEIFLTKHRPDETWEVLAKPGKKLGVGSKVTFSDKFSCDIVEVLPDGRRVVKFNYSGKFDEMLQEHGQLPLPSYIKREPNDEIDTDRYQTVFAAEPGALAAPTAGLHFTNEMLTKLSFKGVPQTRVTLHVGLGTFLPVKSEDIRQHIMHIERCNIEREAAEKLNSRSKSSRQICVGTTCARTLESAANEEGIIIPGNFDTQAYIYPGYRFKYVQHLLTNFHLPGSTLLMLVSAFAGQELIREAYKKAVKEKYRFFSYGDAMLIL